MANRFWVGGSAAWDGTAGTKWATVSGGGGGAAVPTGSDDVFFNAASGGVTVTTSGSIACNSINFTGFTGTYNGTTNTLSISGSITLGTGGAINLAGQTWNMVGVGSFTITTNGHALLGILQINGVGGSSTYTLQDNLMIQRNSSSSTGSIIMRGGTLDLNGFNLTTSAITPSVISTPALILGSGTLTLTAHNTATTANVFNVTGISVTPGTATIVINPDSNGDYVFTGGGLSYNILRRTGTSTGSLTIAGSNTFNDLLDDGSVAHALIFTAGTSTSISPSSPFPIKGSAGNLITLQSTSSGVAWNLVSSSLINTDYLSIKDSHASGAVFYAGANSVNVSGNTGWIFSGPVSASVTTRGFFLMANKPIAP